MPQTTSTHRSPLSLLLIQENAGDVRMTRMALDAVPIPKRLLQVPEGESALAILDAIAAGDRTHRVDMILLSFYLPIMNGDELSTAIRSRPHWTSIPLFLLVSMELTGRTLRDMRLPVTDVIRLPYDSASLEHMSSAFELACRQAMKQIPRFRSHGETAE